MNLKKTKDQVQTDALNVIIQYKRSGCNISMGLGKTLIGLRYIEHFRKILSKKPIQVLIVVPKLSIINSWIGDSKKFDIHLQEIKFVTYRSLHKENPNDYDVVILDECHNLLDSHVSFLGFFNGYILGLTGTPPKHENTEKGRLVKLFCPMMFTYSTDEGVDDEILNDYRLIIHKMSLNTTSNILIKMKNGSEFYTSETKSYAYWTTQVENATTIVAKKKASIMRMRVLMDFATKEYYAKTLLAGIEEKCICFTNTQLQADRICTKSYHSTNSNAEDNLQKFKDGDIMKLSCVLQLSEGVNIPELRAGIILHAYGNERTSRQRIGRLMRLNPNETATIHLLCYKDTIDEIWLKTSLKDFDQNKIKYFNI